MNFDEALQYIHSAPKMPKIPGNAQLRAVLEKLNSPQNSLKFVHIAGTNGKGSTSAMIEAVLRKSGYKTGLFTSPYIEKFNERIQISGKEISDEALSKYTSDLKVLLETEKMKLPEFSLIFVIAMQYFFDNECDVVILETGLGGRLDATNVIDSSLVSVITSIGLDHTQYLGDTISCIAAEKAGIIKKNGTVVVYPDCCEEVENVFSSTAAELGAKLTFCKKPAVLKNKYEYKGISYTLSLKGKYQLNNSAVAIETLLFLRYKGYNISDAHIIGGLAETKWPGRFEWIDSNLLLDGCHNADGALMFAESIKDIDKKITVVTGVMKDKDFTEIAKILSGVTDKIIVTQPSVERSLEAEEYKKIFQKHGVCAKVINNPAEAVEAALKCGGVCAVCGSLYLIGEIRSYYKTKHTLNK